MTAFALSVVTAVKSSLVRTIGSSLARREARVPLRRVAQPEDMAAALSMLVGPDAAYIHGHELVVDGGLVHTLMPSLTQQAWGG